MIKDESVLEFKKENIRLKKALERACRKIVALTGECPRCCYDLEEWEMPDECEHCGSIDFEECWQKYYLGRME